MKRRQAHENEVKKRRMNVLQNYCVPIQIGDVWMSGNQTIRVTGFTGKIDLENGASMSQQDFEGSGYIPWPIVKYIDEDGVGDFIGAPAFKFMTLVQHDEYTDKKNNWDPAEEIKKIFAQEKKQKEKEDDAAKRADGRAGY